MKKLLIIGSCVADITAKIEKLPSKGEDIHVLSQKMTLGGCAYNVSDMARHFEVPYIPFFPVGKGVYGDFVRAELEKRGVKSPLDNIEEENGCCYCLVEEDGERAFMAYHGAEYRFKKEWLNELMKEVSEDEISYVYICGLEIEEETGVNIVEFLEEHPTLNLCFAPGPRITKINRTLIDRILKLHPILHLNEDEACAFTGAEDYEAASRKLYELSENDVIITLGSKGCWHEGDESRGLIEPYPAKQKDTNGAGDSHIGTVLALLGKGYCIEEAIKEANKVASIVVETEGTLLPDDVFATKYMESVV